MPKKTKAIPDDRAEWTFGDLLYWHFFIHGTRPEISPDDPTGRTWSPKEACDATHVTIRGFWNWIDDRHYPYETGAIEEALFGKGFRFPADRMELRKLLQEGRSRLQQAAREAGAASSPLARLPAVIPGQLVTVHTTPFEAAEVDGPLTEADFREIAPRPAEIFGNIGWKPLEKLGWTPSGGGGPMTTQAPPSGRTAGGGPAPQTASVGKSSRKVVTVMIAGLAILFGGLVAKRLSDAPKEVAAAATPKRETPKPAPEHNPAPPPVIEVKGPSPEELRAAEARKREEDRLAALERAAYEDAAKQRAKKESAAREINIKLKALQLSEAENLCAKQLEGLSVPGFTLKCDTLIPFGQLLGSVPVSQTASSLGDCAARCRRVPQCVAFSFDGGAHTGAASCYLTGSIPEQRNAPKWIAGVRQ